MACSSNAPSTVTSDPLPVGEVGGAATEDGAPATPSLGDASWCLARAVLEEACQRCHGATPDQGAPFPLVSYEDTQVVSRSGKPRFELIGEVVASDFMPATYITLDPQVLPLDPDDKATLLAWVEAGGADELGCE